MRQYNLRGRQCEALDDLIEAAMRTQDVGIRRAGIRMMGALKFPPPQPEETPMIPAARAASESVTICRIPTGFVLAIGARPPIEVDADTLAAIAESCRLAVSLPAPAAAPPPAAGPRFIVTDADPAVAEVVRTAIIQNALDHGMDDDPDHEVGDLQDALEIVLDILPTALIPQVLAGLNAGRVDGWYEDTTCGQSVTERVHEAARKLAAMGIDSPAALLPA